MTPIAIAIPISLARPVIASCFAAITFRELMKPINVQFVKTAASK